MQSSMVDSEVIGPLILDDDNGCIVPTDSRNKRLYIGVNSQSTGTRELPYATERSQLRMLTRAIYGEFVCTCIFMIPIFGCIANCFKHGWDSATTSLIGSLVSALGIVAVTFAFSDMSGTFKIW